MAMPTTLDDRYQLDELIGVGAAGRVYRARDLRLGRTVAVKRLRSDALGGDDARARFEREALALARVSDPHVLPVFDVSAAADDAYLVTAFCTDGTLAERLETRVLTCPEVRELVHDVAAGLVAMHGAGIIHRDIKPRNILRLEGRWVIGDLGIARVEGDTSLTQTGAVIGTPDYWAPETARGSAPTPAVDVYGLGCVAFEALAGRPPFRGATPLETGLLHATAATPTLPDGVEERDPALAALVIRMLDKDPADRPMPDELACERPGPAACSDTLVYPDLATVAITQPALPPTVAYPDPPARRRRRVSRRVLLTCGALAVAVALVLAALVRNDRRAGSASTALPRTTPVITKAKQVSNTASPSTLSVPRVIGRSVASATAVLAEKGLVIAVGGTAASAAPRGSITAQSPEPSRRVTAGATIRVTVSAGPPQATPISAGTPKQDHAKPGKAKKHGQGRGKPGHGKK
jgi:eukaryotic-like serine/threonine-protein kinase